ncbi:hypothetical protein NIES4075_09360 [Tolypothrix sp. NIES-4075]|uniref:DUF4335 domain-containing protein n=1 Tax=Tolypothrix sp. NIES-4075 TaxID=2005459 RepID=UPI000B5CE0A6|nr:DUF4335 domain-containing protein [Tolypothrix sp. NIES-4075]GAX39974.1 hypothetical protein NIES4075_09360 [Tolypothrix sp. NIES-4075]
MPVSNPVIRRYTPPTCTLEVLAQSSSLSGWMGKSVLKQLNFELRFDDPRLPEERRISIKGDRDQLEALYSAVTNYVQEFLQKSPESFWASFSEPNDSTKVSEHPELKGFNQILPEQTLKSSKSFNNFQIPQADIHLEPSSYLIHNLFLGSLANQISGGVIQLSLLQLFDLATALDEYSAEVMALPSVNRTSPGFSLPSWTPAAAVVLVALGLTPFTWQYANNIRLHQQTAKKAASTQEVALQPSPSTVLPTPQPGLTPPDNLLVPPLGTTPAIPGSTLPTPPAPGSILPTTPIPGSTIPATPLPGLNSKLPASAKTAPGFPSIPQTAPGSTFSAPLPSSGSALTIPGTTAPTLSRSSGKTATSKVSDPFAIPTNSQQTSRTSSIPKNGIALPSTGNLPSNLPPATGDISSDISAAPPLPTIPNRGGNTRTSASSPTAPLGTNDNSLAQRLRQGRNPSQEVATGTLFDTPQVAEARDFLKKRWQPPTGLKQTLEYSLLIGVDGKVERILPLGKAARDYVDSAGMPGIGQPFVSPNRNGQNVRIRAVLSPDGKVQTFPESE